jgi:eukaryotic-like serine/threonine-protein kinase
LIYLFDEYELDDESFCLARGGQRIALEPKSLRVLILLVGNEGKLLEKNAILETVWARTFVEEKTLTRAIALLRKQLGDDPREPKYIETIPTMGYRFIAPVARRNREERGNSWKAVEAPAPLVADQIGATRPAAGAGDELEVASVEAHDARTWMVGWAGWALSALLLFAGVGGFWYFARWRQALTVKDRIVLADFANSTGDPVFDDTLRQGMTVQLEQSPLLSLVSEEQIQKTLGLMGKSQNTPLTPEVSREICQRTGAAAVLDGSIASLGSQYVLGLRARDCGSGAVLEAEQVQAAHKEDVLEALSQIASRFRTRVGESLASVKELNTPLEEATTPSLEALKAYSTALRVVSVKGDVAAIPIFDRATELDPKFAVAYAWLGRMYGDLGEEDLAAVSTRTAYELREHASERERYFIVASYEIQVTGNLTKAQETCESWEQKYPRDSAAHGFLSGFVYPASGRFEAAGAEARAMIDAEPDLAIGYDNLVSSLVALGRLDDAETVTRQAASRHMDRFDWSSYGYRIAFLKDDAEGMRESAAMAGEQGWMLAQEAAVEAYHGHVKRAREMSQRAVTFASQLPHREGMAYLEARAALLEVTGGNRALLTQQARAASEAGKEKVAEFLAAFSLALAEDSVRAEALADDLAKRFPEDTMVQYSYVPTVRAQVAVNRQKPAKAIELLQVTVPYELGSVLDPAYVRGEAYLVAGSGAQAATEFRKVLDHPGIMTSDPIAVLARMQLGRAYAAAGERAKAKIEYEGFLKQWQDADSDAPLLRQAKAEYARLK